MRAGSLRFPEYFFCVHDLFAEEDKEAVDQTAAAAPLATRMRPRSLDEFVGQEHILAPGKLLRRAIEADRLPSVILSGPPGTGKTTLAQIIAEMTQAKFVTVKRRREQCRGDARVVAAAANRLRNSGRRRSLFVDEIHHFNKTQQDVLVAGCGERKSAPDRRDDLQSVFLRQQRTRLALAGFPTRTAQA